MSRNETANKPLVLVTGSTGKTGATVVEELLKRGYAVRALVHRKDARSERLQALEAEVIQGDFLDLASIRSAMAGVKRVYFCYPPLPGLLEATANVAVAARDADAGDPCPSTAPPSTAKRHVCGGGLQR